MKNPLPLLLLILILYGCIDCGPQKELTVGINFNRGKDSLHLKKIEAIGALDQQIFEKQVVDFNTSQSFPDLSLPISLNADSTTYIFEFDNRVDTLTLFYQRDFHYKNNCGFVTDTKRPASPYESKSTFQQVHVSYESYIKYKVTLTSSLGGGGINVGVTL
jgi:hypothetical protein